MRLQLAQRGVRFSAEHMEAIRQHFKEAQNYANSSFGSADVENKNGINLLVHACGEVIGRPFRRLTEVTELPMPDWRVVAASLTLGAGLVVFGIYLFPLQ